MLRVMKEKVRSSASESSSRRSGSNSPSIDESVGADTTQVIANVPNSISVPTATLPTSPSSSVSSEGQRTSAPLTRVSEDETTCIMANTDVVDSCNESTQQKTKFAAATDGSESKKRTSDHALAHQVSTYDLQENESTADDASTASKKRKLSLSTIPTHVPSIRLLGMPEDSTALNSLHAFCRMQIEVFVATPVDMAQPAPGRKTPIKLHQVGLRCIHCRNFSSRDRIKRAVCYPRSVSRIYNSVSDMKLDHFSQCRGFSPELRAKFQALKEECSKRRPKEQGNSGSTSSTAQYYHDAACKMGLVNSKENDGIFMAGQVLDYSQLPASVMMNAAAPPKLPPKKSGMPPAATDEALSGKQPLLPQGFPVSNYQVLSLYQNMKACSNSSSRLPNKITVPSSAPVMHPTNTSAFTAPAKVMPAPSITALPPPSTDDLCLLALPEDPTALNGLHCFVRRNVEVFIATKQDAAAPCPGRRTRVKVGQVGLRCIHCARLPIKERVKRAVCYPPSVSGIYHSVSNMKFDHFGKCKGLSEEARLEFASLKTTSGHRNTPGSTGGRSAGSTSQYYEKSAARLGLVDTEGGIQFRHQEVAAMASRDSATDGISALMIAATNPTVRADFDRRMAENVATSAKAVASV